MGIDMTKRNSGKHAPAEVVQRYFAAFGDGDVDVAVDCIAENAVWHIDGNPAVGTVGLLQGRNHIRKWLERFPSLFQPLAFAFEPFIVNNEQVIVFGRFRHRVIATGAVVDGDFAIRFTVRRGQIFRYQIFEDSAALYDAFKSDSPKRTGVINRTSYAWSDHGAGHAIVFLHGLFLDRTLFDAQVAALSGEYRCVAFDMPGHGASGWRDGLDLNGMAEDLALWLAEQQLENITIVGHSMGAMVAMRLAARLPHRIAGLVLANTSARTENPVRLAAWKTLRAQIAGDDATERAHAFEEVQRRTRKSCWIEVHADEAAAEREIMVSHDPSKLAGAIDAAVLYRQDCRALLASIQAKTIVLGGELDTAMPPSFAEEIAQGIVDAEVRIVADAAHRLPDEAPNEITDAVREIAPQLASK